MESLHTIRPSGHLMVNHTSLDRRPVTQGPVAAGCVIASVHNINIVPHLLIFLLSLILPTISAKSNTNLHQPPSIIADLKSNSEASQEHQLQPNTSNQPCRPPKRRLSTTKPPSLNPMRLKRHSQGSST